jgi:hypothetical protein
LAAFTDYSCSSVSCRASIRGGYLHLLDELEKEREKSVTFVRLPSLSSHCLDRAGGLAPTSVLNSPHHTPSKLAYSIIRIATGHTNTQAVLPLPSPRQLHILHPPPSPEAEAGDKALVFRELLICYPHRPLSVSTGASCQLHAASSAAAVAAWQTQAVV